MTAPVGLFDRLTAQTEDGGPYDPQGRCRMCGAHRNDHGVGEVCPQERGPADIARYRINPA